MTLPVFYTPNQVATNAASYSPSAAKPAQVVADWQQQGYDIEVHSFKPATRHDFYLAHAKTYVDGVLNLDIDNGFGNDDPEVAASLPYTTGSMLAAAEHAVRNKTVTCSPTSGFHHAGYDFGGGYCTFNGLMVTAVKLRNTGLVSKVGILDCDMHYGNGTDDIIRKLSANWIVHRTSGLNFVDPTDAGGYRQWLRQSLNDMADCDLILYQAGADPHVNDPLGGLLTDKQLYLRDREVFQFAEFKRIPLAWNLAGGYRRDRNGGIKPVLMTHRHTLMACVGAEEYSED